MPASTGAAWAGNGALRMALCAAILLAVSVGTVWMAGPEAPVLPGTWSFEAHEAYDSYQFHGNAPAEEMALWTPEVFARRV